MNDAVGPLSTSPPTIGLTATTGAAAPVSASRMPGTARIGAIEASGLDGPITIARAPAIAASTCSLGSRLLGAAELQALDRPGGAVADHELLKGAPALDAADPRAHGVVAHRQHARAHADAPVQSLKRRAGGGSLGEHARALHAPRQVAVAEVEPDIRSERPQGVHHKEGVPAQSPAALVDLVGQPEGDQVGVRRDVRAVDLDVVARVGDRHQALALDDVGHPPHELRPAGAAGEHDDVAAGRAHSQRGRAGRSGGCRRAPCSGC